MVKTHREAGDFLSATRSMLEEREAENNLILGLASTLVRDSTYYGDVPPLLISVHDDGGCIGAGLQTPPRNLILYARPGYTIAFVRDVCDHLAENEIRIPGAIGPKETISHFTELWAQRSGASATVEVNEMVYRLDEVNDVPFAPGHIRRAADSDRELLIDWMERFHEEAVEAISPIEAAELTDKKLTEGALYLWETDIPVCMAAWTRPTRNGVTIGPVYTPELYRGSGFATSCVARLSALLLGEYQFCSLFTDLSNPTSNSIYRKIGYCPLGHVLQTRFRDK